MAETLAQFNAPVRDRLGRLYQAKACGRQRDDRLWEGWLEFKNSESGDVLRSSRETTQPNLTDVKYWATGLTAVYLEGALDRIISATPSRQPERIPPPAFDGPAEPPDRKSPRGREAVLNPFSVYEKNPDVLAQELTALRGWHLRQIIRDHHLVDEENVHLEAMTEPELASLIMQRVRERQVTVEGTDGRA
jgi:hypothetical protein